jgi:hypothetical protein
MTATRTTSSKRVPFDSRRSDLATIHLAAKELGWSDDEYRDIMATVCGGVRSAGLLDTAGRQRLMAHMRACKRGNGTAPLRAVHTKLPARDGKLWSLWMQLADKGLVQARTMAALNAFCGRQTGVDRIEWLNAKQWVALVESMKAWMKRGGMEATPA